MRSRYLEARTNRPLMVEGQWINVSRYFYGIDGLAKDSGLRTVGIWPRRLCLVLRGLSGATALVAGLSS